VLPLRSLLQIRLALRLGVPSTGSVPASAFQLNFASQLAAQLPALRLSTRLPAALATEP
jgi:hypothetical protein